MTYEEWKKNELAGEGGFTFAEEELTRSAYKAGLQRSAEIFEFRARMTEGRSPSRIILDRVQVDIDKALAE